MSSYGAIRSATEQTAISPYDPNTFEEITTLWIGNCLPGTSDECLAIQMAPYGELVACFLLKNLSPQGQMSGFVRFSTRPQAAAALDAIQNGQVTVNNSIISGKFATKNSSELKDPALAAQRRAIIQAAYIEANRAQSQPQQPVFAQLPTSTHFGAAASLQPPIPAHSVTAQPDGTEAAASLFAAVESAQSVTELEALQIAINEQALQISRTQDAQAAAQAAVTQNALEQLLTQTVQDASNGEAGALQQLLSLLAPQDQAQLQLLEPVEEITTLWIGNCLPNTTDADVAATMSSYGNLLSCFLMKRLSPQGQMSGFVRYASREQAAFALDHIMNGQAIVKGSAISGKWASKNSKPLADPNLAAQQAAMLQAAASTGQAPTPPPSASPNPGDDITTLWVGNIPFGTTNEIFQQAVAPLGEMTCCFLHKKLSPQGQMSGYARFNSKEEAANALQCFDQGMLLISGVILKAKWARQNGMPMNQPHS